MVRPDFDFPKKFGKLTNKLCQNKYNSGQQIIIFI